MIPLLYIFVINGETLKMKPELAPKVVEEITT